MEIENHNNIERNEEQNIEKNEMNLRNQEQFDRKINDIENDLMPSSSSENKEKDDLHKEQEGLKKNESKDSREKEIKEIKTKEENKQTTEEKLNNIEKSLNPKENDKSNEDLEMRLKQIQERKSSEDYDRLLPSEKEANDKEENELKEKLKSYKEMEEEKDTKNGSKDLKEVKVDLEKKLQERLGKRLEQIQERKSSEDYNRLLPSEREANDKYEDEVKEKLESYEEPEKILSDKLGLIKDDIYNKRDSEGKVSKEDINEFVNKMQETYDSASKEERGNNLVPKKAEYLNNPPMSGNDETGQRYDDPNYKWPENNGFEGKPNEITPKEGDQFDRLGNEKGRFVAPIENGEVQPKENRGLPYYFKEDNISDEPSYHKYEVTRDFDKLKDAIDNYNNPNLTQDENREMIEIFNYEYDGNTRKSDTYTHEPGKTYDGKIADAFENNDGGGRQWELPMSVESLKELEMIKKIKEN